MGRMVQVCSDSGKCRRETFWLRSRILDGVQTCYLAMGFRLGSSVCISDFCDFKHGRVVGNRKVVLKSRVRVVFVPQMGM